MVYLCNRYYVIFKHDSSSKYIPWHSRRLTIYYSDCVCVLVCVHFTETFESSVRGIGFSCENKIEKMMHQFWSYGTTVFHEAPSSNNMNKSILHYENLHEPNLSYPRTLPWGTATWPELGRTLIFTFWIKERSLSAQERTAVWRNTGWTIW